MMSESSSIKTTELVKPELPAKQQGIQYPGGYDPLGRPPSAFNKKVPLCGADDKKGGVCGRTSERKPSDNPAYGGWEYTRCRFHGGTFWKKALKKAGVNLHEKVAMALADNELQDAQHQVESAAGIVALFMEEVESIKIADARCAKCGEPVVNTTAKLNQMAKLLDMSDTLSKITKREHEMRVGKQLYVKVETVDSLAQQIVLLVHKHFSEHKDAVAAFVEDVKSVRLPG
jgi:hypothetical protein